MSGLSVLVTGGAGFIGFHATRRLLDAGHRVTAIDSVNDYYDPALKRARLAALEGRNGYRFLRGDIADPATLVAAGEGFDVILHLAAQAGVRYAVTNPSAYTQSNLVGHANVLEFARHHAGLRHLIYASSSSVYGNDSKQPFSEDERADHPISYYGATKRAGELLSYSYASLYGFKQIGLRFFTVYGPWGRPDMAMWSFTQAILEGRPIPVFGGGKLRRDFTYIDDIAATLVRMVEAPFVPPAEGPPHRIYNLGNSHPESVLDLIGHIERAAGAKAVLDFVDGPPGDVLETYANVDSAARDYGYSPRVKLAEGAASFVRWYRQYRGPAG